MSELLLEPTSALAIKTELEDGVEKNKKAQHTVDNSWHVLREYTAARIGLGRAGISVPTKHLLDFQLAHAQAQDAVHLPLNIEQLSNDITLENSALKIINVHSKVIDRAHYLQRPDLGRRLNDESIKTLTEHAAAINQSYDVAIVVVDGLASYAVQKNSPPFLTQLIQRLASQNLMPLPVETYKQPDYRLAPLVVVEQGRVAIGDEVAQLLNAKSVLVLIGERPGLSSPDSLGLYLTWAPKVGLTDESRNCISNVRPQGLVYSDAVDKIFYLLSEAHKRKLTGINLKENAGEGLHIQTPHNSAPLQQDGKNFLIS